MDGSVRPSFAPLRAKKFGGLVHDLRMSEVEDEQMGLVPACCAE